MASHMVNWTTMLICTRQHVLLFMEHLSILLRLICWNNFFMYLWKFDSIIYIFNKGPSCHLLSDFSLFSSSTCPVISV